MKPLIKSMLRMSTYLGVFLSASVMASPQYFDCHGQCQAKKAVTALKPYSLANKGALKNPLGSEVCVEILKGSLTKSNGRDVCRFKDKSSVDLQGLHLESEKFMQH